MGREPHGAAWPKLGIIMMYVPPFLAQSTCLRFDLLDGVLGCSGARYKPSRKQWL